MAQLQTAVQNAAANSTIMIAAGRYTLNSTLYVKASGVTLRGATNNRNDVVLVGRGMSNAAYGSVPFGIWTNAQRVTIANLTIRDVYYHAIIFNSGAEYPRVRNVRLVNTGQQFIKANPDGSGGGVDNGIVEYSLLEYETTSKDYYTNGIDVHSGANWIVRNNLFRRIQAPLGQLAGPAVLMWHGTHSAIIEGNTFINCQSEIAMGLVNRTTADNSGGIVRNNFIYRDSWVDGDAAISVRDSPSTQVLHNSILVNGTYPSAIEYRFSGSAGVVIRNNLMDAPVKARDGATGTMTGNLTNASAAFFVNAASGNLHLSSGATTAIDQASRLTAVAVDWDGQARLAGSGVDIGADEYVR